MNFEKTINPIFECYECKISVRSLPAMCMSISRENDKEDTWRLTLRIALSETEGKTVDRVKGFSTKEEAEGEARQMVQNMITDLMTALG